VSAGTGETAALGRVLLRAGLAAAAAAAAVLAVGLVSAFGPPAGGPPPGAGLALGVLALAAAATGARLSRAAAPVRRGLGDAPPEAAEAAFAAVVTLPRVALGRVGAAAALCAPALLGVLALATDGGWLRPERALPLLATAVAAGLAAAGTAFVVLRSGLQPLCDGLAGRVGDPERRAALVTPLPLGWKLGGAAAGAALAVLLLTVAVAEGRARGGVERLVADGQARVLSAAVEALEAGAPDGPLADASGLALPVALALHDPRAGAPHAELPAGAAEAAEGRVRTAGGGLVSWRALPDGRVLVASTPGAALDEPLRGLLPALVVGPGLLLLLGVAGAWRVGRDAQRTAHAVREQARRFAAGDLRAGVALESDDELGELGRAFEAMGEALRATVGRVSGAADRLEAAAAEIATVADSVGAASADQVRRIQQAAELMTQIEGRVQGVAGSAQDLNVSVEESSSSILELGAAGDELNDTASVLSERVEEVSSSIEEMARSAQQIGQSGESLAEIAGDTSASMEEMASAMRAVDQTAVRTAELSSSVVDGAEGGRQKVQQTIEGMEAIRDATDWAERVIRGLGQRTREIGAILDVIDDVADETNLLALNAAIIAAQAGDQGRAFSVVADEIKELADRVLASTKEIGSLIRAVQEEGENATGAIEQGSKSVASGVELSAEAGIALEEITRAARESGSRIAEIVRSVEDQTQAAGHVASLMERVRGGVEQIRSAGAEQERGQQVVHRSAVTMREVALQVRRTTEEQARGFGRIRESVEDVRGAVERIHESLREQSGACKEVAAFLEEVYERTRSNQQAGDRMGEAMRGLLAQAEGLRRDVAGFQI